MVNNLPSIIHSTNFKSYLLRDTIQTNLAECMLKHLANVSSHNEFYMAVHVVKYVDFPRKQQRLMNHCE